MFVYNSTTQDLLQSNNTVKVYHSACLWYASEGIINRIYQTGHDKIVHMLGSANSLSNAQLLILHRRISKVFSSYQPEAKLERANSE